MWERIVTRVVVRMLKSMRISIESRQLLTSALLDRLGALPLHARITIDETGQVFVDKRQVTLDTATRLRETSRSMMRNFARRFVREQVLFMAVKQGVYENTSPEQGLFAKAALWFFQEEEELYRRFAQDEIVDDD